jgi:dTDP-4-dehydrorhamnose reductase
VAPRRVLVTGASGQLGHDLVVALSGEVPAGGLTGDPRTGRLGDRAATDVVAAPHSVLDVTRREEVLTAVCALQPQLVIHTAAFTAVDACEGNPDQAFGVNALGTRFVAEAARRYGAHLVVLSTDYVFDGTASRPYVEWDEPRPASVYGRSKLGGEREAGEEATIVRTSWLSGHHGKNIVRTIMDLSASGRPLRFVDDQRGSPSFCADVAGAILALADAKLTGVYHVTNSGETSWYEFARAVVSSAGGDPSSVEAIRTADLVPPRPAPRPAYSVLDNAAMRLSGLPLLPSWEDGLERLVGAIENGATRNGATRNGATKNGATKNGTEK